MTDYVVACWCIVAASELLSLHAAPSRWSPLLFCSAAAGLAILAKPIAYAYLPPLALLALLGFVAKLPRVAVAARCVVAGVVTLGINASFYIRNYALYGYPFGVPRQGQTHLNRLLSWRGLVSNAVRHAGIHAGTPWEAINDIVYRGIVKIHLLIGLGLNDPRTTSIGPWRIWGPTTQQDIAGNSLHAYVYVAVFAVLLLSMKRVPRLAFLYSICALATFLLFAGLFKWQPYSARFHLPFFVLFAPVAGLILLDLVPRPIGALVPLIMLVASWEWLVSIQARPLLPIEGVTSPRSVVAAPRNALYLGGRGKAYESYSQMAQKISSSGCSEVGIMVGGNSPEYLLWAFLDAPRSGVHFEWIVAGTPSVEYADEEFSPCAVVCEKCPEKWDVVRGLPIAYDNLPYRLFMNASP